jgi:hypothetical protein
MTGKPFSELQKESRRRRLISSETTTSDAFEQLPTFIRRALLLSLGFALLLALTSSRAGAASSAAAAGKLSARLSATELVASQARSTRLLYKLPASSTSLSYRLSLKKGSTWQPVVSAAKKNSSASWKRLAISKLFAGRTIKVGGYRLDLSSAGVSKSLVFQIVPFSGRLTKKSFTIAEARSIRLIYAFSKPSKSFAYRLLFKQDSKWRAVSSAKTTKKVRKLYFVGQRTAALKSLFGKKSVKLGSYRLLISSAYSTRQLKFTVVKTAKPATSPGTSGTGAGTGNGSTGSADFSISGDVSGLEPGLSLPVRLTLTNPNSTKIYVTHLAISMSADSTPSGCSRAENFTVTQSDATSSDPIAVPAKGSVTLTSAPRAPQISFLNLSTSQDVCKGKSFALTFSGSAHS